MATVANHHRLSPDLTDSTATGRELRLRGFDARLKLIGGSPSHSIDEELTDYADINADGLPDIVVTAPGLYGNDYGLFLNGQAGVRDFFGGVTQLGVKGVLGANSGSIKLSNANVALLDGDGDGIIDVLHMPCPQRGTGPGFERPKP
jgi:hypothetical protein